MRGTSTTGNTDGEIKTRRFSSDEVDLAKVKHIRYVLEQAGFTLDGIDVAIQGSKLPTAKPRVFDTSSDSIEKTRAGTVVFVDGGYDCLSFDDDLLSAIHSALGEAGYRVMGFDVELFAREIPVVMPTVPIPPKDADWNPANSGSVSD